MDKEKLKQELKELKEKRDGVIGEMSIATFVDITNRIREIEELLKEE